MAVSLLHRAIAAYESGAWPEDVLKYTETASRREIYTPSATQVIQPIYKTSMGQWRRYEAQLAPVLPVLAPWVRKFGY